jgi:hypothetical protein
MQELLETIPGGATIAEIMQALGVPDWTPEFAGQASLDVVAQHIADIQGQLNDWQNQRWPLIQDIVDTLAIHGDYLAEIRGKVNQYLPVTIPTIPSAAGVATAVWNEAISIHVQANVTLTARQALLYAGKQAYLRHLYSPAVMTINPDFALANYENSRWMPVFNQWSPAGLNPRGRPVGETVLAYLQRVQPSAGWYQDGKACIRDLTSPGGGLVASLVCLLSDLPEDPPEADGGEAEPVDLEPVLERLRLYMPLPGEGTAGAGVIIAGEGRAMLEPNTIAVLIDLPEIPEEWGQYGSDDPVYDSLGGYAFLSRGAFAGGGALRRAPNWLAVPPGADEIWWLLRPSLEGALTFVAGATP